VFLALVVHAKLRVVLADLEQGVVVLQHLGSHFGGLEV
jgi:aminoglycoside/choline kinase family phosphotransferase